MRNRVKSTMPEGGLYTTSPAQAFLDGYIDYCELRGCDNRIGVVLEFGPAEHRIRVGRCKTHGDQEVFIPVASGERVERVQRPLF